ncbi:transcription factor TGA2.2-like isoform X2 [Phragmites australis]|nr:transcription factor TGA2.2-like isoform X2 [Phragmites australis]
MTSASVGGAMGIYGCERRRQQPFAAGVWGGEPFRPDSSSTQAAAAATVTGAMTTVDVIETEAKLGNRAQDDVPVDEAPPSSDSFGHDDARPKERDQKRLAQNREAARKSRLRKKAYIQNLETSRMRLAQLEQELTRVRRQQGVYVGASIGESTFGMTAPVVDSGVAAFEMEYAHWVEEQNKQVGELRTALQSHAPEIQLRILVDAGLAHYDALFRAKSVAARSDAFFVLSGVWRTPAERFFLWIGGFRPSELLKILAPQLESLTEQQASAVRALQQTARQVEDALSQGMDKLQQTLVEALMTVDSPDAAGGGGYAAQQMASAVGKLDGLAGFVDQADHLRQQTLRNMHKILTPRQAARGLLALGDYCQRLRALSSLWAARPREPA